MFDFLKPHIQLLPIIDSQVVKVYRNIQKNKN